ncbi:hypothetical protein [Tissierella praeacuta]|uniref:hypothetical protein n=1 Tax=Tissierella praeacuta TaxID=43131 RepID=UPI003342A0B7
MEEIKINEKSKDESLYKGLSLIFGLLLVFIGIKDKQSLKLAVGILLLFYSTYHKNIYLSDNGIVYTYRGFLFSRKECLEFNDMDEITIVKQKHNSTIFFIKEPMVKKLVINDEKIDKIIEFINKKSKISINIRP